MATGIFKLINETVDNLAANLAVSPPNKVGIRVKDPSGMPTCQKFAATMESMQEVMQLYAQLLDRDASELRQFIADAKTTDET